MSEEKKRRARGITAEELEDLKRREESGELFAVELSDERRAELYDQYLANHADDGKKGDSDGL